MSNGEKQGKGTTTPSNDRLLTLVMMEAYQSSHVKSKKEAKETKKRTDIIEYRKQRDQEHRARAERLKKVAEERASESVSPEVGIGFGYMGTSGPGR